jgi:transmembrane sensor
MSESHHSPTPEQLSRFLAGNASPPEEEAVRRWLAERVDGQVDVEGALRRVKRRRESERRLAPRLVALAAAAAVVMVAGTIVARRGDSPAALTTHRTAVGQRDSIDLADGSRVVLGPGTSLSIRAGEREVELRGEAYFNVVHDPDKPFVVRVAGSTIRDLGTAFTVSGDSAATLRVVVSEGIVEMTHASDSVTLRPGDVGAVTGGRVAAQRGAATPDDLAWLSGRLVFRDAPLAEVDADLRRWYGVELRVSDTALLRRHFTGAFAGEPADRVLEVLALALGARIERRGDTAFVSTPVPK